MIQIIFLPVKYERMQELNWMLESKIICQSADSSE